MSIDRFHAILGELGADLTPRELAETLWLACHTAAGDAAAASSPPAPPPAAARVASPDHAARGTADGPAVGRSVAGRRASRELHVPQRSERGGNAVAVLTPGAPMLSRPLDLSRALRPLKRKVPTGRPEILDEEATAAHIAEQPRGRRRWAPVLAPGWERRLELALVFDASASMPMWQPLAHELAELFARVGAFRDVRLWNLVPSRDELFVGPALDSGAITSPGMLVDPSGRRAVLVLSDCAGPHWWDGRAGRVLHRWAAHGPTAILQPLPERMWYRTAITTAAALATSSRPYAPNGMLRWSPVDGADDVPGGALPVPVMEIAPNWLRNWSHLVAGTAGDGVPAAVACLTGASPPREVWVEDEHALPVEDRVARFRAIASPQAYRLAGYVALTTPWLPIMKIVLRRLIPGSRPAHLAELILSGLLRPDDTGQGLYTFVPGAQEALLETLTNSAAWHAIDMLQEHTVTAEISAEIEAGLRSGAAGFTSLLRVEPGRGNVALGEGSPPYAVISARAASFFGLELAPDLIGGPLSSGPVSGSEAALLSGPVPEMARAFQPRAHLRALIEEQLGSGTVILRGGSGTGKSQLAAACARDHAAAGTPVFWVNAATIHHLLDGLNAMATALGPPEDHEDPPLTAERGNPSLRRHLLILDDAANPELVARTLRSYQTDKVILTTRDRQFDALGHLIEVTRFTDQEALSYLRETVGEEHAEILLPMLGRVPAILSLGVESVIRHFPNGLEALERWAAQGLGSSGSHLFDLLLDKLPREQVRLLEELALLDPRGISVRMFSAEGERAVLEALTESALVGFRDGWVVFIHDIIQEAVRDRAGRRIWDALANAIRRCELIYGIEAADAWRDLEFLNVLIDHATALLEHTIRLADRDNEPHRLHTALSDILDLHGHALGLLNTVRDFSGAISIAQQVLEHATPLLPQDHPGLTRVRSHLATAYEMTGRHDQAINLHEEVRDARLRTLGSDHPDTQDARDGLALAYLGAERYWDAIDLQEQLLTDRQRTHGLDDAKTLMAYNNLALSYLSVDRADEAVTLLETAAETGARAIGESHQTTLITLDNLALAYARLDREDEAVDLHRLVVDRRTLTLGEKHPDTLISLHNLADVYQRVGLLPEAITLFQDVLATREDLLGADHPDTVASRTALVLAHERAGDLEAAIAVCRQGVERLRILLEEQAGPQLLVLAQALTQLAFLQAAWGGAVERDAALNEVAVLADRMARNGDIAWAEEVIEQANRVRRSGVARRVPARDGDRRLPSGELDPELESVFSTLSELDPVGDRVAGVLRRSFDQVLDGVRTGRFRWDQLTKTEKTGMASWVAMWLGREFGLPDGVDQDYEIDGVEVGCSFSTSSGGWMFAPSRIGGVRVLLWANDEGSVWGMGVLRVQPRFLAKGGNRDGRRRLNKLGHAAIRWIHDHAPLPRNVLLSLPSEDIDAIFRAGSVHQRLRELFLRAQGRIVSSTAVATVAMTELGTRRVRDVRGPLGLEGIVILGNHREHCQIAEALALPVPSQGELMSIRLARRAPHHHEAPWVEIRGEQWVVAQEEDPVQPAPPLL
ncbi:NaeI family type II restriction endonuclease [Nonomuraea sp. NPDC049400]|uniref:NaeI family type II restriction endonuclease n=1 Tax=Nonomuraea sp. NPDC049400 TaxID=3364352 RepID=UPI0037BC331A